MLKINQMGGPFQDLELKINWDHQYYTKESSKKKISGNFLVSRINSSLISEIQVFL